jgi:hypothetical protein
MEFNGIVHLAFDTVSSCAGSNAAGFVDTPHSSESLREEAGVATGFLFRYLMTRGKWMFSLMQM